MKAQLATLFLVFSFQGTNANSIRGTNANLPHRNLKSGKRSESKSYRVVGGKKGFKEADNTVSLRKDDSRLWIVVDSEENGQCASAIAEWVLEKYLMDFAFVERDPKNIGVNDVVVELDKKTKSDECQQIALGIANEPAVRSRKRGVFDAGVQNIAVFDVKPEDKKCEDDCKDDREKCEEGAATENEAKKCKSEEDRCEKDCCKDNCKDNWEGIFINECNKSC